MLRISLKILIVGFCIYLNSIDACYLWGTASGVCTKSTLDPVWKLANMPYCGEVTLYPACVPQAQAIPPNREFPTGRWGNHTVLAKDTWVSDNARQHIAWRIYLEKNATYHRRNTDEYGDPGRIKRRFSKRPDCQKAYKSLFCYINFPRCDPDRDITLPTCKSACENFFKSCVYGHDLWRCGQSKYFNGYFPEVPVADALGNLTYLRDYFPGQPFRKNKYNRKGKEIPICTPAVTGSAYSVHMMMSTMMVLVISLITMSVYLLL